MVDPNMNPRPDAWLRGPVAGVPAPLQPVAHALLQCVDDVGRLAAGLTREALWTEVGGAASVGFHLRHMTGSLDRLFTYARGETLNEAQRAVLASETERSSAFAADALLETLRATVDGALAQLRATDAHTLDDHREVGRARLPSTVLGLLFHAAEHCARHAGQVATTVRILRSTGESG